MNSIMNWGAAMRHESGCNCPFCCEQRRRMRMRRVAWPTSLPGLWIVKEGFTKADFEKAQNHDGKIRRKRNAKKR